MEPSAEGSDLATKVLHSAGGQTTECTPFVTGTAPGKGALPGLFGNHPSFIVAEGSRGLFGSVPLHPKKRGFYVPMSLPKGHGDRGPYFTTPYQRW